nr:LysE family translocator [Rhizobium halophytocola]
MPKLLLAWSIQLGGILSPGPSVMLILGIATTRGRLPAVTTSLGVACGSIVLSTATVVGLAVVLADLAHAMTVVRIVGALYLVWLSYKAFKRAVQPFPQMAAGQSEGALWRTALGGFFLQVTNPKAIFFWLAIAGVGGIGDAPLLVTLLFIAGAFLNSLMGHAAYALLLSAVPVRALFIRFHKWVDGALGCFFAFAGYTLLMSRS